jgi:PAS domain S-box-containing protein
MKILAVDNHPVMIRFLANLLEKEGHEVCTAKDGLEALKVLKHFVPDVIFLDLIMPKIDGRKLCRVIRQKPELEKTFIAVLSAVAIEEGMDFKLFGANACIAKGPLDKLGPNILEVLELIKKGNGKGTEGIHGKDYVFQRTITKELIHTKRHFEIILDNMSEGILELTDEGFIVFVNPAASQILTISEENLLGTEFFDLFDQAEKDKIREKFLATQKDMKPYSVQEAVRTDQNNLLINFLPTKEYEEIGVLVIIEDITEKMRIEAKLRHMMKMEVIGTFSGGIAHDFNNLLMGIQGNISVMLLEVPPTHPHYDALKKIEKIVKSGSELTAKLLGYARKGKYESRLFNLNRLVIESVEMFTSTKKEIKVDLDLDEDLKPIEGDRVQFEQVLLNLYVNAWQAMPEGGTLRIETKNVTQKEIKSRRYKPERGKYVRLKVSDSGIGIDEAVLEKIFDPFFTTKEIGRGSGLGLASAYGIVKNHKGYIEVKSRKGKGTTFLIYIPASSKKLVEAEEAREEISAGEKILLVDDEEMVLDAGERMLRILGYEVITAKGGRQAVDLFRQHFGEIQMVILDMIMPEMGGAEVYKQLKALKKDVKVLISSGYSMNGLSDKLDLEQADGFLQKPYNLKQLYAKTRELLESRCALQ